MAARPLGTQKWEIWEVSTKLGWNPTLDQRLQLTLLHYRAEQDTDYASNPAVTQLPLRSVKASAIKGLQLDEQNTARNEFVSLEYSHDDILAGTLHGQLYYREYLTRFYPFDSRAGDRTAMGCRPAERRKLHACYHL